MHQNNFFIGCHGHHTDLTDGNLTLSLEDLMQLHLFIGLLGWLQLFSTVSVRFNEKPLSAAGNSLLSVNCPCLVLLLIVKQTLRL